MATPIRYERHAWAEDFARHMTDLGATNERPELVAIGMRLFRGGRHLDPSRMAEIAWEDWPLTDDEIDS